MASAAIEDGTSNNNANKRSFEEDDSEENSQKRPKPNEEEKEEEVTLQQQQAAAADTSTTTTSKTGDEPHHSSNFGYADGSKKSNGRWRTHQMAEDYIGLVGDMMYPGIKLARTIHANGMSGSYMYPIEQATTLGYLMSPIRRPTVIEKWSPYEIAMFEASIMIYGKVFHEIQKFVPTKTTKEVIEFYYIWKKTNHYKQWKEQYVPDFDDDEFSDDDVKKEAGKAPSSSTTT